MKKRSPRDGELIPDERLDEFVQLLDGAGVDAMSVPTDATHFGGSLQLGRRVRRLTGVPLLRKEFFSSAEQMDQSRDAGFDAVQLSLGTIPDRGLFESLRRRAERVGLEVVVGVHGEAQLATAIELGVAAVGLNNRDITALELDAGTVSATESLITRVPEGVLVISESGLLTSEDVARAGAAGAHGVLIGTAVAQHPDPAAWLRSLRGWPDGGCR